MKVLVSGFGPFGINTTNPSEHLMSHLNDHFKSDEIELKTCLLPVTFSGAFNELRKSIVIFKPDVVISFGLAENRDHVTLERIAVNIVDARIADNDGEMPKHKRVDPLFPSAGLFTTLPIDRMCEQVKDEKLKVSISNSAGTYVCNQVMFKAIADGLRSDYKAGFIHLPPDLDLIQFSSLFKKMLEVI